jgi:hypothetical protein
VRDRQPAASVTAADVERIARREFPGDGESVLGILAGYGTETWHREADRVRAAILKLSHRSLDALCYWTEIAKSDYRDVLASAEYPRYGQSSPRTDDQHNQIIRSDREQYDEWFRR